MIDNLSRYSFTFNPWTSVQGRWLQHYLKKMLVNSLFWIHGLILKNYNKDAYIFDDVRIQKDRDMLICFFAEWCEPRKQEILNKMFDIFFFMMKEDAFYRRLYIVLRNKFILEGQITALTNTEQEELMKWRGK